MNGAISVDVVVIGGGVNGTGVARDATLRGLKVALFERSDFAFGASGNSSGMIHGGPRYLTADPNVTRTSCLDSGNIQKIAPHLLFRVPFLMPVGAEGTERTRLDLVDAFFEAYDFFQPLKRGKPHARLTPDELYQLEPGLFGGGAERPSGLTGGITFDEWGIDGTRLVVANAMDARERGAAIYTHTTVETIVRDGPRGRVTGVLARNRLTGERVAVEAKAVVNATGAWSALTAAFAELPEDAARVRPGKGIHVVFDRRLTNYAVMAKAIDGRQIFVEPWQNVTVLGTTDDDFYGDLDDVSATADEVRYLIEGVACVLPAVRDARVIGTTAGVRPTLYAYGPSEDELSRDHRVIDHASHGAPGLYSMVGGKLASYRIFAEEMTDVLVSALGVAPTPCRTHLAPLPGGEAIVSRQAIGAAAKVDAVAASRLVYRHGARAERIAERIKERPLERAVVCACEPVIEAEVRHVIRSEMAATVDDVARRTRLGLGACGGMRCAARCGQIVAEERGLAPRDGQRQALRFLTRQARARAVAMSETQARQEALLLASVRSELGPLLEEDE
ncbi:MAG TPA: glycerol-3-phosphate dehydrogenase/oxidase [Polyangiaceae bacterium]|nr:glycerol-3-phosphate dehydrogenase/oxidase [Polyangiaceae bacterium]